MRHSRAAEADCSDDNTHYYYVCYRLVFNRHWCTLTEEAAEVLVLTINHRGFFFLFQPSSCLCLFSEFVLFRNLIFMSLIFWPLIVNSNLPSGPKLVWPNSEVAFCNLFVNEFFFLWGSCEINHWCWKEWIKTSVHICITSQIYLVLI